MVHLSSNPAGRESDGRLEQLTALAAISLGLAAPMLMFGKAPIFVFLFLPALVALANARRFEWPARSAATGGYRLFGYAAAATALLWLVSSIVSSDVTRSLVTVSRTVMLFVLAYFLIDFLRRRKDLLDTGLRALVVTSAIMLFAGNFSLYIDSSAFDFYSALRGQEPVLLQLLKPFDSVAACMLPVILWAGYRLGGPWRLVALITVPLTLAMLYGKGQQSGVSALFGLAAACAAFGFISLARRLPRWLTYAVIAALGALALALAVYILTHLPVPPVEAVPAPQLPLPDWHRQVIWGFTLNVLAQFPFFGVGPDTINFVPGAGDLVPGLNQEYVPSHPHNWMLEIASETGLLGLFALLVTMLVGLRLLFLRALAGEVPASIAIAVLAAFWCSSLGNFSIWAFWWLSVLAVLLSFPLAALGAASEVSDNSQ